MVGFPFFLCVCPLSSPLRRALAGDFGVGEWVLGSTHPPAFFVLLIQPNSIFRFGLIFKAPLLPSIRVQIDQALKNNSKHLT